MTRAKEPKDRKTEELPSDRTLKIRLPDELGNDDADERTERTRSLGDALPEAHVRLRMSSHDAHYGGDLVDGARILGLFGDIATELLIRHDGDEGLFRAYETVEFLAPVRAGDYVEAVGRILQVGKTSRRMSFEAWKVISPRPDVSDSAADVLRDPVLVARAIGTCVVPADKQRRR